MTKINSDHISIGWDGEPKDILLIGSVKRNRERVSNRKPCPGSILTQLTFVIVGTNDLTRKYL